MRAVPFCSGLCHMFTLGRNVPAHAILTRRCGPIAEIDSPVVELCLIMYPRAMPRPRCVNDSDSFSAFLMLQIATVRPSVEVGAVQ